MNLGALMDELAEALQVIPNLQTYPFWVSRVTPPAAVIAWPDPYEYDATYGRGSDTLTLPVILMVGAVDQRSSRDALSQYADGTGDNSIKQTLEAFQYTQCDSLAVRSVRFSTVTVAGVEFLAGTFLVHVIGRGA